MTCQKHNRPEYVATMADSVNARQAITTSYLPYTNHRSSRVKAKAAAGSVTLEWDHAYNVEKNHARAAMELARRLGWRGDWIAGGLVGSGYVFVGIEAPAFTVTEG
jgi:hypothetical protein